MCVDTNFERGQFEARASAGDETVEIRAPCRTEKACLGEMAKDVVANMRSGRPDLLLKVGPAVSADRIATLDVEAIFIRAAQRGILPLSIKPSLNALPDARKGEF